jgi:hypothetical protein
MSRKTPAHLKSLNDTLDIMTLMTHTMSKHSYGTAITMFWRADNYVIEQL